MQSTSTLHPLIIEASKVAGKNGYKVKTARARVHTDPHTRAQIETSAVSFSHRFNDMPLPIHRFLKTHMEPTNVKNKEWRKKGSGEVAMKMVPLPKGGHELHFTSVKYRKL